MDHDGAEGAQSQGGAEGLTDQGGDMGLDDRGEAGDHAKLEITKPEVEP